LPFGCPLSTLTMYVSKALNRNIRMLVETYRAMRKQSKTKVKKEITHQEWK
jgi:ribosomal protein L18E